MANGLVKGEGFAVDASFMEANASRYHGKAPDELDWTEAQRQKRAVADYLAALEAEPRSPDDVDRGRGDGEWRNRGRRGTGTSHERWRGRGNPVRPQCTIKRVPLGTLR